MARTAALFSGQGAQYPGMGKELYDRFKEVREIYALGSDVLGFDLAETSFSGGEETLGKTGVSQPLIFTLSMAAYTAARLTLAEPEAFAGHSLGEYAALCAAGAYSLEDGFRIIKARAAAMEEAAGTAPGAMYAIIGPDSDMVAKVCGEVDGFVEPVNFNLPTQTVISGEEAAASKAAALLEEQGAKAVRLSVSSAFHTKMMAEAAEQVKKEIASIPFQAPKGAFYSNLTGGKLEIADFPDYFAKHMTSPVRFVEQIGAMAADGIDTCVEFGPKKTAATLAKKNVRALTVLNVEDNKSLDALLAKLG